MSKPTAARRKRAVRETRMVYTDSISAVKRAARKPRAKKLIVEMRGGEPYEFYPLGEFIVAAPGICGGRPTFKYTRIDTQVILEMLAGGWSIRRIVNFYQRDEVSPKAIREAILLATEAMLKTSSVAAIES